MTSDEKRREVAEQLRGARPTTYYAEELVVVIKDALLPAYPTETWREPTDVLSALADLIEPSDESYRRGFDEGFASADDWYAQHTDEELAEHGLKRERTCRMVHPRFYPNCGARNTGVDDGE